MFLFSSTPSMAFFTLLGFSVFNHSLLFGTHTLTVPPAPPPNPLSASSVQFAQVDYNQIPRHLSSAVLLLEDRTFFIPLLSSGWGVGETADTHMGSILLCLSRHPQDGSAWYVIHPISR